MKDEVPKRKVKCPICGEMIETIYFTATVCHMACAMKETEHLRKVNNESESN